MSTRPSPPAPNALDIALGVSVRNRRKALKKTQGQLAAAVDLTFQQIQKYERGFNRISFSRLVQIARALDCRIIDLLTEIDLDAGRSISRPYASPPSADGEAELLAAYVALAPPLRHAVLKLMLAIARERPGPSVAARPGDTPATVM
jgi:transcriptional regulator with XRE-family HTH domain